MSVQVKQPMLGMLGQTAVRSRTGGPRQTKVAKKFHFGELYAVGSCLIIWGGFLLAFWSLI